MPHKPFKRLILLGFILLLGVQMTGMSCLDEWADAFPLIHMVVQHQAAGGPTEDAAVGDDGCPCHLAFVSFLSATRQPTCPIAFIEPGGPALCAFAYSSLPFHPPISL